MYKSVVRFNLRSSPYVDLSCVPNELEVDGVRVRCSDDVVTIKFEVVDESPEVVNELGRAKVRIIRLYHKPYPGQRLQYMQSRHIPAI